MSNTPVVDYPEGHVPVPETDHAAFYRYGGQPRSLYGWATRQHPQSKSRWWSIGRSPGSP